MGRAPCCDKANVKKGPWSPEEDAKLKAYIEQHGTGGNWIALPQKIGLKRCGKSCRLRWLNYLRPNIKHGDFSEEEENIICSLYVTIGSRWSIIAAQLPGRTDNDIKNYWNTRLKKKLLGKQRKEQQVRRAQVLKQEPKDPMINNFIHSNPANQFPYWPEPSLHMPQPYQNQEPSFNDHPTIRKLLLKLGGRLAYVDQRQLNVFGMNELDFPIDVSAIQLGLYENPTNIIVSSTPPMNSFNRACTPISEVPGSVPVNTGNEIFSNQQRLEGLELEYYNDVGVTSNSNMTNSGESSSRANANNSAYNMHFSKYYEVFEQGIFEGSELNGSRYMESHE